MTGQFGLAFLLNKKLARHRITSYNVCYTKLLRSHGRLGFAERPYPEPDYVAEAFEAARAVPVQPIIAAGYSGEAIRQQLGRQRQLAIRTVREHWQEK